MSDWLEPIRSALDRRATPCEIFFRDDDAGWEDGRLRALLDRFSLCELPIDVAVIPAALSATMARELRLRAERVPDMLGLHQHGFRHLNHESTSRKCEFGPSRTTAEQRQDIELGAALLARMLGQVVDPFFTPPWNRCTDITARCLAELDFRLLSREHRAEPLGFGPQELPVSIDWCKRDNGKPSESTMLARRVAHAASGQRTLGIMLHHAVMDETEQDRLTELLTLLAGRFGGRVCLMRQLARPATDPVDPPARVGYHA